MENTSNVLRCVAQPGLRIHTAQFDPVICFGKDFTFWLGPKTGSGLEGLEEDCDTRSLRLITIDFSAVEFINCYQDGEGSFKGEEKLDRLKLSGRIRHGPSVAVGLLRNYGLYDAKSALERIHKDTGITYIDFPGRVLRDPEGFRCIVFLHRSDGGWRLWYYRLDDIFGTGDFTAVSQELAA